MGNKAISEADGVCCSVCNLNMPKNDWQFTQFQNFYCFFCRTDEGQSIAYNLSQQSSKTVNINKGTPVVKYFRSIGDFQYKCAFCFSKTESVDTCRAMDQDMNGKGIFSIPQEKLAYTRREQNGCTTLRSFHNTQLRGNQNGSVDLTSNNDTWQKWELKQIDNNNRYYIKSCHGTYLRGYPDGKVDLSPNMMDYEIWTKVDFGSYRLYRSIHGTYLRGHPDGKVDLAETALEWERWVD